LHHYGLEKFLADLFDREYYGPVDRGRDWESSLEEPATTTAPPGEPGKCVECDSAKKIGYYSSPERNPRIALGLGVADVGSGKVDVMDENASVVCGLRAATALIPMFPAVRYEGRLFIDSTNVSPVPMPALMSLLRRHGVNAQSTVIHVYRVSPVPFSRPPRRQAIQSQTFLNLIDTAFRAIRLRQYRDADLERRLTEHYSEVIPVGTASVPYGQEEHKSFRMWVAPVELDLPVGLNARIMFADRSQRRAEILKTIAQGCRAALEVMIADAVKEEACSDVPGSMTVPCARAVRHHLMHCVDESVARTFGCHPLPGSRAANDRDASGNPDTPPGLWEICEHCELGAESAAVGGSPRQQALVRREWENTATNWPHEFDAAEKRDVSDRHFATTPEPPPKPEIIDALGRYWPRERRSAGADEPPANRPLVSLLFSGGVFRGVFQVGVVNALSILGVKPDIVAGASVGSITAGMAAQLLCVTDGERERTVQLARLAAAYLAVDRVILTDRFADFVREFTIRAAGTRFSLRQADQLFRKYDQPWLVKFEKGARQVIGGIERLFYVNPYQLRQLVKAARHRRGRQAGRLGRQLAQQWLDRMNVGEEVLGAEALSQLIEYFIPSIDHAEYLTRHTEDAKTLHGMFAPFLSKGVMLLATATNLTDGQLLTLGDPFRGSEEPGRVDLANALLASSAFPGVFRPRWAPEVFPDTHHSDQYIDGGVMDNLPIDAVLNVLRKVSSLDPREGLVVRRPTSTSGTPIPHLAFAASLEPEIEKITNDDALSALETYWPALRTRAKQLGYNCKLDNYREAAFEISRLHDQFPRWLNGTAQQTTVNLEIMALKPRWLCGTFAFHPMLGYRRAKQAESIAHGCALTLLKFKEYTENKDKNAWLDAWGVERAELPVTTTLEEARERWKTRRPEAEAGECWLRQGKRCPFSAAALEEINSKTDSGKQLKSRTIQEVSSIHTCCEKDTTHGPH
jgi:predicted acylesterase/phospholipase RssA